MCDDMLWLSRANETHIIYFYLWALSSNSIWSVLHPIYQIFCSLSLSKFWSMSNSLTLLSARPGARKIRKIKSLPPSRCAKISIKINWLLFSSFFRCAVSVKNLFQWQRTWRISGEISLHCLVKVWIAFFTCFPLN